LRWEGSALARVGDNCPGLTGYRVQR